MLSHLKSTEEGGARGSSAGLYNVEDDSAEHLEHVDHSDWRLDNNVDALEAGFGMVWIEVEVNPTKGCGWTGHTHESNCEYLHETIQAVKAKGKKVGVYTSIYEWE